MHTEYNSVIKEIQEVEKLLEEHGKRLDEIETEKKELEEKYPNKDMDSLIREKSDINVYQQARAKIMSLDIERINLNSTYMNEYDKLKELNTLKEEHERQMSQAIKDAEVKAAQEAKDKNDYIKELDKLLNKQEIIKGKEASKLGNILDDLNFNSKITFLTDEEKKNYISAINDKLTENNKLINEKDAKVKEPKVKTSKKCVITNKLNNVIAKGKKSTISAMKKTFDKSIGKAVKLASNTAKSIYSKFVENSKKTVRAQIDMLLSDMYDMQQEKQESDKKYQNEIDNLKNIINNMQNHMDRQDDLNNTFGANADISKLNKRKDVLNQMKAQAAIQMDQNIANTVDSLDQGRGISM